MKFPLFLRGSCKLSTDTFTVASFLQNMNKYNSYYVGLRIFDVTNVYQAGFCSSCLRVVLPSTDFFILVFVTIQQYYFLSFVIQLLMFFLIANCS